jgi:Transposase.
MATVFWDHNGVVLAYFLVRPDTVNVEHYCNTQGVCGRPSVAKGLGYSVKA